MLRFSKTLATSALLTRTQATALIPAASSCKQSSCVYTSSAGRQRHAILCAVSRGFLHELFTSRIAIKARHFGRIAIYTLSMYLVTHLIVFLYLFPIGVPTIILNHSKAQSIKKGVTGVLFRIIGQRLEIAGIDQVAPKQNYLIVSNYPGSYAGFALMNVFPEASILVHSFLSRVPLVVILLRSTGAAFVQWKTYGRSRRAIDGMLEGVGERSIIVLPEGGRSPDGRIRNFRRGFIYILRHSSLQLLPVTLKGFYRLKPAKRLYLDPDARLQVLIHRPIDRNTVESLSDAELLKLTTTTIQGAYALQEEIGV